MLDPARRVLRWRQEHARRKHERRRQRHAAAYLVAHGCGEREGGAERNTDAGPRSKSSAAAPSACMATARLTARRHEKAPTAPT